LILLLAGLSQLPAKVSEAQTATIYYGNDAQFGSSATSSGSLQGFTQLRDRWNGNGVPTTITDIFSVPQDCCIFYATAPTTAFSAAQVAAVQTFVSGGGTFIISHDGSPEPAMNQILSAIGSSMQFGAIRPDATVFATVVGAAHPFMSNMTNGDVMYSYSPGQVTGGTALVDYPVGTHIVSVESIGQGTVMAVADFDMLNNVVGDFFPNDAIRANNIQFWDNISEAACVIPEPSSVITAGIALAGLFSFRRRGGGHLSV
jgi:hypothetical protein